MADYPPELAGAHGRIAAYRATLALADDALAAALPYVDGVRLDPANAPWRRETARDTLDRISTARATIEAELAVTSP